MNASYSVIYHDYNTREVIRNIWEDQMKERKYIWEKKNGELVILSLFCYGENKIFKINMKEVKKHYFVKKFCIKRVKFVF